MDTTTFASFDLHPTLLRGIEDMGFTRPTPIQRDSIPPGLAGRDVLACAQTGSGKTAAFLLPILQRLLDKRPGTTRALVLTPTRELASQIVEHFRSLARHTRLRAAAVYGGVAMGPQEQAFRQGTDLLVACPGRLLDHFRHPYAGLRGLEVLVLDEVDRMLDMGFLPDVRRVLRHLPKPDQALFFSATLPAPIAKLSRDLLRDPAAIAVERPSRPAPKVNQVLWPVREELKRLLLLELLQRGDLDHALVFTRTKHRANRLAEFLGRRGVVCDRIHGNRTQAQRTKALAAFKSRRTRVLVATDIAARGIDVADLSHVINFDVPHLPEDYIHRIGRTARAEAEGDAYTFVSGRDEEELRAIERAVGRRLPRRTLEDFDYESLPKDRLEIPVGQRIAAIRERRAEDRRRGAAKKAATAAPAGRDPRADSKRPDSNRPASMRADSMRHDSQRPDSQRPDSQRPDSTYPDSGRPTGHAPGPARKRRSGSRRAARRSPWTPEPRSEDRRG